MRFKLNASDVMKPALRVIDKDDIALKTPNFLTNIFTPPESIAAIIHVFYPDLMPEIATCLNNFEKCPDVFISTDSEDKAEQISSFCQQYNDWEVVIKVVENRGRDVAPMIVAFKDVFYKYEYCLHLHTKKTNHKSVVANWRKYLFYTLCGSREIVLSNLSLLQYNKVGFIYPQNINVYRHNLSWGGRFVNVQNLLAKSDIELFEDNLLEFPSSTMFFARTEALRILLEQNIQAHDFEPEEAQITATLAHDIETSLLYFVEASGFKWVKVSYNHGHIVKISSLNDLELYLDKISPTLLIRRKSEFSRLIKNQCNTTVGSIIFQKLFNSYQKIKFMYWNTSSAKFYQIKDIGKL